MPQHPAEARRLRTRSGHGAAWASFVTCGAAVAILLLAMVQTRMEKTATRVDIGHGAADAFGVFLYMVLILFVAGIGLLLAIAARRRAPGDPFVELALGTSMLTLAGLFFAGPLLLELVRL